MRQSIAALRSIAAAAGIVGLLTLPAQRALAARQGECAPAVQFHAGLVTCYLPAQVGVAQRRLSVRPINPVAAVDHVLPLPLRQALVLHGTPTGRPGLAVAIVYVFGTPSRPHATGSPYVLVRETIGDGTATGIHIENTGGTPGPWLLHANLPGRTLTLSVTSNARRDVVRKIGHDIIQSATGAGAN